MLIRRCVVKACDLRVGSNLDLSWPHLRLFKTLHFWGRFRLKNFEICIQNVTCPKVWVTQEALEEGNIWTWCS